MPLNVTNAPTAPDFPAEVLAKISPGTKAAFVNQMAAAGYNRAELDQKLNVGKPVEAPAVNFTANGLDERGTAEAVRNLRENWSGDRATLDAALARLEGKQPGSTTAMPASLAPPTDGNYQINFGEHKLGGPDEVAAANSEFSSAFSQIQVPAQLAQGLADALLQSKSAVASLNDVQRQLYNGEQKVMLAKLGDANELIRLAAVAAARMPPATYQKFSDGGFFASARSIAQMAAAGRSIEYRESKQ
jgi:hypothetical protein